MTPADLIQRANAVGVRIYLSEQGTVKAAGERGAIAGVLPALRANRSELARFLSESRLTVEALLAAMTLCDLRGDDDRARAEMRSDVLATPEDLLPDLIAHLNQSANQSQRTNA